MKQLVAAAILCALALPAAAQNAITQEGTTVQNAPVMLRGNNRARQGATVNGAPSGQIIMTGDAVVGGRCDYSAPTDDPAGYYKLCVDAKTGKITFGGTKSPVLGMSVEINGSVYGFPGAGNGNVIGPTTSTINEITSWNSALGTELRQGAARITDNKTAAITGGNGATFEARTNPSFGAPNVVRWSNYDAVRGVGILTTGSTSDGIGLVNGVGGYVISKAPFPGGGWPTAVGVFAFGIAEANNSGAWGMNTSVADNYSSVITSGTGKYIYALEADMEFTSPNTAGIGIVVQGLASSQPSIAFGISCGPLDLGAFNANTTPVGRWTHCFDTADATTDVALSIGRTGLTDAVGTSSQMVVMGYNDEAGVRKNLTFRAIGGATNGQLSFTNMDGDNTTLDGVNLIIHNSAAKPGALVIGMWQGGATAAGPPVTGLPVSLDSLTQIFQRTDGAGNSQAVFMKAKGGANDVLEITGTIGLSIVSASTFIARAMPTSCTGQATGTMWKNGSVVNVC